MLLSASPLATQLLEEAYPVRAEILEVGQPRNDRLVLAADEERQEVRERLGIGPEQVAVLYAPTWRDYATTNSWVSDMVDFVDPGDLARQLGAGFTVLLRGHPSHGRGEYRVRRQPGVVDVTYQPDINDLIIASDLGIFDYSSIRFDYAVTNKPMVFFVPDLARAFEAAPPLIPYEGTTPGPLVMEAADLATAVQEVLADPAEWATQYEQVRKTFVPYDDGHAAERFTELVTARAPGLAT
jgi:CDP-glycerol glycerophosphotransferase